MKTIVGKNRRRGAAMILALALTLCLTMLVVATQLEVITEFKTSRTERDFERALQMAEAGVNAYQHRLTFGTASGQPGAALLPPLYEFPGGVVPTLQQFRQRVLNGTYTLVRYPAGSQQGYFVGTIGTPGDTAHIVSYGWSNGVARRVSCVLQTEAAPQDIEDDTQIHPSGEYALFAVTRMTVENNNSLVGGVGTNGTVSLDHNSSITSGSLCLYGPNASFSQGNNVTANVVRYPDPVVWPTVAQIADRLFPSGGLTWLATHNDNGMATINGVAGIPNSKIYATNNVTVVFNGKAGGANYYITDAYFKNNATIRFNNSAGPIRIWIGPLGGSGGWYSKNNADFTVTSTDPANAPRLYMATTGGFTGKNNVDCNFGIYAYNADANGNKWGHIEVKNNMLMHGTFVANEVTMKNNTAIAAGAPFWQPLGAAYYDMSVWQE
ncbi:MAG: hypothetical protein GX446_19020 [Chthonomonadales bacterium]|nr:hypothetical protein [Chthonomonadales bacterium]